MVNKKLLAAPLMAVSCGNYPVFAVPFDETTRCLEEVAGDEVLEPYAEMLSDNRRILEAADFCNLPGPVREMTWEKIKESEENNLPPAAPKPQAMNSLDEDQNTIELTEEEACEIYAAKLAHAFWSDQSGIVAWKLSGYDAAELKGLLTPGTWFSRWNAEKGVYEMKGLADYSPRITFSIVGQITDLDRVRSLGKDEQYLVVNEIIKSLRAYRHGADYLGDSAQINTVQGMFEEKVSRFGCQTMAPYFIWLANVLNIPGRTENNHYLDGKNHQAAVFEGSNLYLSHGDNFYNSLLANIPAEFFLDSYGFWQENVFVYDFRDWNTDYLRYNVHLRNRKNAMEYPSKHLLRKYCLYGGYAALEDYFGLWATPEGLSELRSRIEEMTGGCTFFPEDNPDGLNLVIPEG